MKKIFFIYCFLCFNFIFCQKISLKTFDFSDTDQLVKYIAKELKYKYKDKDLSAYYDNIFRISMITENYDASLDQLDSVRNIYRSSHPDIAEVMGSQYEIFINALKKNNSKSNFKNIYEEAFRVKYESLNVKSQILFPQYFSYNEEATKKDINDLLSKAVQNDSISIIDAIQLCRKYNNREVAKKSYNLAIPLITKLEREFFTVYDSIKINTKNQGNVSLTVILNNKIPKPQATILINTIYSDKSDINLAKEYAFEGYACVILNSRGKYLSSNPIEPFEHENIDVNETITWIINQKWSNGDVGMIGGSYLGFSQWAATKKMHPALKTIVPLAPVGIGTMDFPMNNNVFSPYVLRWLTYVMSSNMTNPDVFDEKKWNLVYKKWYQSGKAFKELDIISGHENKIFQRWLRHPCNDEYWQKMVPYKKEFSRINIPILTVTGYYDSDQLGALYYFNEHHKYNKKADHYLIIGPYDHNGAQGNIKKTVRDYEIDSNANINLNRICIEWFDHILKKKKKPSFLKDKINFQMMGTNEWFSTNSFNSFKENRLKLYLSNESRELHEKPSKDKKGYSLIKVDFADRSDADELLDQKYNIVEEKPYNKNNIFFSTDVLKKPLNITGNFSGSLKFSINKHDVDLYVHLYELMPNGKYFLLSTYLGRASFSKDSRKRKLLTPGKKDSMIITNNEFVSKVVEAGSKLIIVVGVNKTPMYEINYGTGKNVSEETIKDAQNPLEIKISNDSYFEIPIFPEK